MHPGSPSLGHPACALRARLLAALVAVAVLAACEDEPTSVPVSTGTIGGVPFTVVSGVAIQAVPDGAIRADPPGAVLLLDQSPAALGMSDAGTLHLLTNFALEHGGTITLGAFGTTANPFATGTAVVLGRNGSAIEYVFYVDSAVVADSAFTPPPASPSDAQWVVTEFYADSVPGYAAGSGITMWPLDDLSPTLGGDVLGCTRGPAMSSAPLTGDRVAIRLAAGFLLGVAVVDTIVGPCI